MNVNDFLYKGHTKNVPNPNYNPRAKKNKQPKTIEVLDLDYNPNPAVAMAVTGEKNKYAVPTKDIQKYNEYGLEWSPQAAASGSLDKQLADAQGTFTKFGNAVAQAVVSELALGTVKGFTDLVDVIGQAIGVSDKNYSNPVSATLEEWQEKFRNDVAPIYTTPGVDISNGGLTDAGWWASNLPSVISSLTLLLPSTGVTRGIGKLVSGVAKGISRTEKARKVASSTAKWAKRAEEAGKHKNIRGIMDWAAKPSVQAKAARAYDIGMTAALSRTMENYQEARQTYNDMYADASKALAEMSPEEYAAFLEKNKETIGEDIDTNDKDAVAKAVAAKSADKTFLWDYSNIVFDIIELYGLKNMAKGLRNGQTRASVRRAHKESIKTAGMTEAEKEAYQASKTFRQKAAEKIEDWTIGSRTAIGAQLSEGIEEGINYVAQQEGMNLGHVMLGRDGEGNVVKDSSFSDRFFNDYIKNPQLYESAFWGVFGGIAFQGLGSTFYRAQNAIELRNEYKKKEKYAKEHSKTDETIAAPKPPSWKELWLMPEIKRRKADIEAREKHLNEYLNEADMILHRGLNPYQKDQDGQNVAISDRDKEVLLNKAYKKFVTSMALNAMDSGNFDMFKEYIGSNEVKEAIKNHLSAGLEDGTLDAETKNSRKAIIDNMDSTQQSVLSLVDKIEKQYDDNIVALNRAAARINREDIINRISRKRGKKDIIEKIPLEYLQIIARQNIDKQLDIEELEGEINSAEQLAVDQQTWITKNKGKDYDFQAYRNAVRLQFLTRQLAEARAEKNELIKDKERLDTVVGQEELNNYDKYIKNLQDIIYNLDAENGASNLLFAIEQSLALEKDKNTGTFVGNPVNLDYINFRDKIVSLETEEDAAKIKEIDDYLVSFDERLAGAASNKSALHQKKVIEDMVRAGFDKNTGIDAVSKDLHETYFRLADLQLAIAQNRQQIYITDEEIADRAAEIHNGLNEARRQGIQKSKETIFNLADKYGSDAVRQAIYDRLFNKVPEGTNALIGDETLTEEEQAQRNTDLATLHEALDYLHLEADANKSIITQVDWILALRDDVRAAQRESSSTNQNRNLDEENSGEGSTSQTQPQTPTQPQNGQNGNQQPQQPTQQQPQQQPTTNPQSVITDTLEDENGAYAKLTTNNNTNGEERELQITDTKHPEAVALLNDDEMFAKDGVSLTDDFVITKNPIVIRKSDGSFEVVEAGEIAKPTQNNINQANQIAAGSEEVQEEVVDEEEIEEPAVKEPTEETTEESANEEAPQEKAKYNAGGTGEAVFSSTGGEQSNSPFDDYGSRTKRDSLDIISSEINAKAMKVVATAVAKGSDVDFAALQEELIKDYVKDSTNEEAIRIYIDRAIKFNKTLYSRTTGKPVDGATATTTNPEGAAAVDDLIVMSSQLRETRARLNDTVAEKLFENVEKLVKRYAKDSSCDVLTITNDDGTSHKLYCINLEDLFRYCREVTDSEQVANLLAENLIYVMQKNKDKYFLIDGNTPLEKAIENSFKSTKDRITSITTSNKSYGINILGAIGRLKDLNLKNEIQAIYDILDNIKPGDKIQYSKNPDYPNQIVFSVNGKMIGVLPVPIVDANTGGVYQYNDGWKTDILDNGDGTISSNLKQLFRTWLLNSEKSDSIRRLNDIILRMAFTNPKGEALKALLKEFAENEEIIRAKAEGFTDGTSSDETLLNGLSKLWAYTREIAGLTTDETNELRATTLDSWFDDEVASSFALVQKLNNNESGEVELAYISEGELIRVDKDKTLPVSEGIGSQHREHIKLGAAKSRGVITISGDIGGQRELPFSSAANAVGRGGTFVVIPARNGQHQYVQAFARPVNSITTGSVANIIKAIHREFKNIEQLEKSVEERGKALEKLVRQLFSRDNNSPLFTIGSRYKIGDFVNMNTGEKTGFTIEFVDDSGKDHTVTVTWKGINKGRTYNRKGLVLHIDGETKKTESTKTGKTIVDEVNNNVADRLFDVLSSNSKFSIGFDFIDSDNNLGTTLRGVASRNSEGKFVITIPNSRDASNSETFEFDSFSSFILDNDLITVRTKPDAKGSNFKKTFGGNNNRARQQVKIKEVDSTTPVEESSATKQPTKQVSKTTVESVLDILTSDSAEKGWQIGKLILKSKARQKATLPNISAFIFPENLIFANENIGDTALTIVGTKPVKIGNTVVQPGQTLVGNEWINLLRRDRNQAVRKLIHEQLHQTLHTNGNEKYIEQIREIFDEFARKNTNPELEKYLYKWNEARYYTDGKLNEEGLEEFLVETLTSKELADALNNMTADNPIERKGATSILQKLMDVLAKMLGFDIKKGSVYEKEFMLLRDIMSEDNNANTTNNANETITNEQTEQEEQPVQLELNFTETSEETIERHNDTNENASIESVNNYEIEDIDEDEDERRSVITENTPLYETVAEEMQSIKEQAIANGTFMKAPNGNPTNLTERQWLQVRTKAFKDWFGDWERAANIVYNKGIPGLFNEGTDYKLLAELEKTLTYTQAKDAVNLFKEIRKEAAKLGHVPTKKEFNIADIFARIGLSKYITTEHFAVDIKEDVQFDLDSDYNEAQIDLVKLRKKYTELNLEFNTINRLNNEGKIIFDALSNSPYINTLYTEINSTSDVSKVVDENGEPLVVYHYTDNENLTEFSTNFDNYFSKSGGTKKAIFFTEDNVEPGTEDNFLTSRKKKLSVFLNIRNLEIFNGTKEDLHKKGTSYRSVVNESANKNVVNSGLKFTGFDDNRKENQTIYVVHDSNQIKSATDNVGTFSRENNDIRYSSIEENSVTEQLVNHLENTGYKVHNRAEMRDYLLERDINKIQAFIGKKSRDKYEALLKKYRPDINIEKTLDFLHNLEDNKENTSFIKAAIHWMVNKSITIPRDIDVVKEIFAVARKKHIDLYKYKTILDLYQSGELIPKQKTHEPFNPDTAKTFYDKEVRTTANGRTFVIYSIENTDKGREEACKAISAHYDASPWCVSTFTATGNPTASAKKHWKIYNAIERKIAYENGKPVAFSSAKDGKHKEAWWDMTDTVRYNMDDINTEQKSYIREEDEEMMRRLSYTEFAIEAEIDAINDMDSLNYDDDVDYDVDYDIDYYLPFFKSQTGEIYGFVSEEGEIYLDETKINPEHPIHEYTHLWDRAVAKRSPKLWNRGVELMKQIPLWKEIEESDVYGKQWNSLSKEEKEFRIASEVHARLIGQNGAQLIEEIENEQGSNNIIDKLKDWLLDVFKFLKGTFSNWSDNDLNNLTLEDFNNMTMRDFIYGVPLDTTVTLQVPTVSNFIDRLPLDVQTETREKINNGEIQVICR